MTGQVEEQVRVQLEHKKALQEKLKIAGVSESEELTKVTEEITKLQELLKDIEDKARKDGTAFDYPRHDR